jgi:hypothetical protein
MNALKHGLDAQTLILPGEHDAAFRARLDAWRADVKPRGPLEDALVEQAARLSWQLDRADRVQAALLAERIRLAGDDEARRRDQEAADAVAIGQRLILGGNRRGMHTHPDDPDHPERLLGRLESTADGCRWLLDRWAELRAALEGDGDACWRPEERLRAVRLLAKAPVDAVDDPMVLSIYLGCLVLDPDGPQVFADQAEEMTTREFEYFLQRLAGRGVSDRLPPDRESAREGLLAMVDGVIEGLESLAAAHADRAEALAASAPDRLAFDDSPDGERIQRLHVRLLNSLLRTIDTLRKVRREPGASLDRETPKVLVPPTLETLAPSPIVPADCEELRNEPTAAREELRNEPIAAHEELRNEPTAAEPALESKEERVQKVAERSHRTPRGQEKGGSGPRIDESNPTRPSCRVTGRPGMSHARTPRVPISLVRPRSLPVHRRRRTPAARPPPR